MEIVLLVGGVAVAWWLFTRVFLIVAMGFYALVGLAVVGGLALLASSAFGWPGAVVVVGLAVLLWRRTANGPVVQSTGRYGYGPGDIMPPSPKGPDGRPL